MSFIEPKINVLLVDDDTFLVMLYKRNVEHHTHINLDTAHNGEYALDMLRAGLEPHVILLDINMPGMSGVDVLRTIRTQELVPDTDIIIVSCAPEDEYADDFDELGIDGYIHKASMLPSHILHYVKSRYAPLPEPITESDDFFLQPLGAC